MNHNDPDKMYFDKKEGSTNKKRAKKENSQSFEIRGFLSLISPGVYFLKLKQEVK